MGSLIHLTVSCLLFLIGLPVWFNRQPAQDAGNPAANSSTWTSHLSCARALAFAVWPNVYAHAIDHPKTEAFATTLFAQSAVQVLDRSFPQPDVSYLLLDANSGALLASRWENPDHSIPLGSLVKPFTALAYAETHDFRYPAFECGGQSGGCWHIQPHGKLNIVSAISVSCNAYFRSLAESISAEQLLSVTRAFDVEFPGPDFTSSSLVGLGERWKVSPLRMAHAYLELYRRRDQPGVRELLAGLRQSARTGTGAAIGRSLKGSEALVKTGTAPCTHLPHAPADGFVIALVPAQQPEILLMVRVHGVAGAAAAETAARMLAWVPVRVEE